MIRPRKQNVVAKRVEPKAMSDSGRLHLPEKALERTQLAKIIAVGEEIKDCQPGDVVMIGQYTGYDFDIKGEKFVIILEKDILAVYEARE